MSNNNIDTFGFLDVLNRGTTVELFAESFTYQTTTEILDAAPNGGGGVLLPLQATIEDGELELTAPMIAAASHTGDYWELRHGGLVFRFDVAESSPAFG